MNRTAQLIGKQALEGVQPINCSGHASLPLLIQAAQKQALHPWVMAQKPALESLLRQHGALLLRNFQVEDIDAFRAVAMALSMTLMPYQNRATPRQIIGDQVYTSTDYPSQYRIFLHNENAFAHTWPTRLFFHCVTPPVTGGETSIADCRRVLQALSPDTRAAFAAGVLYVRNFGQGLGLPWQEAFGTTDKTKLAVLFQEREIGWEWQTETHLRTWQVRPAIATHPETGEQVWFNHAATLHVSTQDPTLQAALQAEFADINLPNNTYFGNGRAIPPSILDEIRAAYQQAMVKVTWQRGDVLLLDNLLVAHGREPYQGPRRIAVAMANPMSWSNLGLAMPSLPDLKALIKQEERQTAPPAESTSVPWVSQLDSQDSALVQVLSGIWANALDLESIGLTDNFFELGGQSIDATDIVMEIRELLQSELSLLALAQAPTIAQLLTALCHSPQEQARLETRAQQILAVVQMPDSQPQSVAH